MNRRAFVAGLGAVLGAPLAGEAQQAAKVYRIGVLSTGREQESVIWTDLRGRLGERGWVEGRNLSIEWRHAEANYERLPALAAELVRLEPDLIIARGGPSATAAKRATATIPIVIYGAIDPVSIGLVQSLARPGGNVTGLSPDQGPEIMGKRLQLLKEVVPLLSKVASLTRVPPSAAVPNISSYENVREELARSLGLEYRWWHLQGIDDLEKAFTAIIREGFGALDVHYVPVTWTSRQRIREFAMQRRLPAVYWHRAFVLDGGLMAYGEDERDVPRRLAIYVDKILRGAKPADLPVEQPTKFELVINLKTAKALGLTIPQSLLVRADQIIE